MQAHYPGAQVEIPYKQRMCDKSIDEISISVRSSNGLMRANAGTFGRLWDLMNRENGLRAVRNLGAKSEVEIFALSAYYLSDAIVHTANGASELFYWNKKEAYTLLQVAGHQLPGGLPRDGFVSSICDTGSNVKTKYSGQTGTDDSVAFSACRW